MDLALRLITGDLTPAERVWSALLPGLCIVAYFLLTLAIYAVRFRRGGIHDPDIESRPTTALIGVWIRLYFLWAMAPVLRLLRWTRVPADAVTMLSTLLGIAAGVAMAGGRFALGGWLYVFSGIGDFLDGRLAREQGRAGPRGAALDSVLDRVVDGAVMAGLAWFYRDSWVLLPALVALVSSFLVSYVRARGEALGVSGAVGMMQRAERILYLGLAVAISPVFEAIWNPLDPRPVHGLAVLGLVLMAISTTWTAIARLRHLLATLAPAARSTGGWLPNAGSALAATAVDAVVTAALSVAAGLSPAMATLIGALFGGVTNFGLGQTIVFAGSPGGLGTVGRYVLVSVTSALLNAGGVAVLMMPGTPALLAWLVTRVVVFVAWNHPLQRDYVFAPPLLDIEPDASRALGAPVGTPQSRTVQPRGPHAVSH